MGRLARHGRTEATTAASPDTVWRIITDVTRVPEYSHECRGAHWKGSAQRAAPGVRFRGTNRSGLFIWSRSCVFTVVDEPRTLAWKTVGLWGKVDSTEWRIDLEPIETGARIIQSFNVVHVAPGADPIYWLLIKAHRDRSGALGSDMQRLAALAERVTSADTAQIEFDA